MPSNRSSDHTRVCRLVSNASTLRVIESLRPPVLRLVDTVLFAIANAGTSVAAGQLIVPLPFQFAIK